MFYRENGQYKTSYKADQALFPIAQDRIFIGLVMAIAFIVIPMFASEYLFRAILIPFLILLIALNLDKKWMNRFAIAMLLSSFLFGLNLSDPNRGSAASLMAFNFKVKGQPVSFDPLMGPVLADHTKQKNMISFSKKIISQGNTAKRYGIFTILNSTV